MRTLLEHMEEAAEETLHQSATFFEAVQSLKEEIDHDPRVRETVHQLRAAGRSVFNSFVPHIKIRVRTEEGIFSLPQRPKIMAPPPADTVGRLTQQLKSAASSAIKNSRHFQELELIVNEAVSASERFEGLAMEVETAGHEVLICLDLSAYVEVRSSLTATAQAREAVPEAVAASVAPAHLFGTMYLSGTDVAFLKGLGIRAEG